VHGNKYQFQLAHVGFIPQVLSEVEVVHILVDESERVFLGRVHPHERHCIYIPVAKEVAYVDFVIKPLQGNSKYCARHKQWLQRTATTSVTLNDM
jgi:hypothetical protein